MDPIELTTLAAQLHHVLTPDTRRELGLSRSAWGRLLQHDGVERPFRGVAVLDGAEDASLTRAHAAAGALRCDTALTGWTAAHVHGLVTAAPTKVHLLMRHGASVTRRDGLVLTETSAFPTRLVRRHGLLTVPGGRMFADLAASTTSDALMRLAVDARFAGVLGPDDLDAELAARKRFPGRRRLRTLADELRDDTSDSGFEHRARQRLTDEGMAPDPGQEALRLAGRERRIDLPYRSRRAGVECLGFAAHSRRTAFDEDAERRNDFAEDGSWLLLELTWTMFVLQWPAFVVRLGRVLASRPAF